MKRITIRPGKRAVVSDEALARARSALTAFGVRAEQLTQLAAYKGDVTLGKAGRGGKRRVVRVRAHGRDRPRRCCRRGGVLCPSDTEAVALHAFGGDAHAASAQRCGVRLERAVGAAQAARRRARRREAAAHQGRARRRLHRSSAGVPGPEAAWRLSLRNCFPRAITVGGVPLFPLTIPRSPYAAALSSFGCQRGGADGELAGCSSATAVAGGAAP